MPGAEPGLSAHRQPLGAFWRLRLNLYKPILLVSTVNVNSPIGAETVSQALPACPSRHITSDLVAYLHADGFEDVVLLEPFVSFDKWNHSDPHQVALAAEGRILLLEPPLIEGVLPAGHYLAEIEGLLFEVIGPDGEIWRFTIRAESR